MWYNETKSSGVSLFQVVLLLLGLFHSERSMFLFVAEWDRKSTTRPAWTFLKTQGYRLSKCGFMGLQHSVEIFSGQGVFSVHVSLDHPNSISISRWDSSPAPKKIPKSMGIILALQGHTFWNHYLTREKERSFSRQYPSTTRAATRIYLTYIPFYQ